MNTLENAKLCVVTWDKGVDSDAGEALVSLTHKTVIITASEFDSHDFPTVQLSKNEFSALAYSDQTLLAAICRHNGLPEDQWPGWMPIFDYLDKYPEFVRS